MNFEKMLNDFVSTVTSEMEEQEKLKQAEQVKRNVDDTQVILKSMEDFKLLAELPTKEVIFCNPYTILLYYDKEGNVRSIISKCMEKDKYSKEKGLHLCAFKALKKLIQEEINKF